MTKYKIPDGMVKEALNEFFKAASLNGLSAPLTDGQRLLYALEAAIRWLAENPIVPTYEQTKEMHEKHGFHSNDTAYVRTMIREWQRRMLLDEPEVPEEIKDLLLDEYLCPAYKSKEVCAAIIEAFRRGKASK